MRMPEFIGKQYYISNPELRKINLEIKSRTK